MSQHPSLQVVVEPVCHTWDGGGDRLTEWLGEVTHRVCSYPPWMINKQARITLSPTSDALVRR